jgi:hypothetical protein
LEAEIGRDDSNASVRVGIVTILQQHYSVFTDRARTVKRATSVDGSDIGVLREARLVRFPTEVGLTQQDIRALAIYCTDGTSLQKRPRRCRLIRNNLDMYATSPKTSRCKDGTLAASSSAKYTRSTSSAVDGAQSCQLTDSRALLLCNCVDHERVPPEARSRPLRPR